MRRLKLIAILFLVPALIFASGSKERSENVTTVTIWHSNSGLLEDAFSHLVDQFNENHEDIKINAVYQGAANDVLTSVNAAALAGSGLPDIILLIAPMPLMTAREDT